MTTGLYFGDDTIVAGASITPPPIRLSDDTAWAAIPSGYPLTLTWGDGIVESIAFAGITAAYASVTVALPTHAYLAAGSYAPTLSVTDPAGHATTVTLLTASVVPGLTAPAGYPRVVGIARVGRVVTCQPGSWGDPSAEVQIRWLYDGRQLYGRTTDTLRLGQGAKGVRVACRVIVSNAAATERATSPARKVRRALPVLHRRH